MQKLVKYLAKFSVFLSLFTVLNIVVFLFFVVIGVFGLIPADFFIDYNDIFGSFFMFVCVLVIVTVAFISLLQSFCILQKSPKNNAITG